LPTIQIELIYVYCNSKFYLSCCHTRFKICIYIHCCDIKKLKEIIEYYSTLGISIKNSYALSDFYKSRKPENIIMGLSIDFAHNFFKRNKYLDPFKETIIKNIRNNEALKKLSKIISNQGLSF